MGACDIAYVSASEVARYGFVMPVQILEPLRTSHNTARSAALTDKLSFIKNIRFKHITFWFKFNTASLQGVKNIMSLSTTVFCAEQRSTQLIAAQ